MRGVHLYYYRSGMHRAGWKHGRRYRLYSRRATVPRWATRNLKPFYRRRYAAANHY